MKKKNSKEKKDDFSSEDSVEEENNLVEEEKSDEGLENKADVSKEKPVMKKQDVSGVDSGEEFNKPGFLEKVKNFLVNYWVPILAVIIIIILIIVFVPNSITGRAVTTNTDGTIGTDDSISEEEAGELVIDFAEVQGLSASILNIEVESGLYKVDILVDGQEVPVYLTLDGKNLVAGIMPLDDLMEQAQEQTQKPAQASYSDEDLEEISEFASCLSDAGMKMYAAEWCGYCKQVVELFGGYDVIEPIYVECTENEELCNAEEIKGYPTIKVNGEAYQGARNFESFAQATGCPVPVLS